MWRKLRITVQAAAARAEQEQTEKQRAAAQAAAEHDEAVAKERVRQKVCTPVRDCFTCSSAGRFWQQTALCCSALGYASADCASS